MAARLSHGRDHAYPDAGLPVLLHLRALPERVGRGRHCDRGSGGGVDGPHAHVAHHLRIPVQRLGTVRVLGQFADFPVRGHADSQADGRRRLAGTGAGGRGVRRDADRARHRGVRPAAAAGADPAGHQGQQPVQGGDAVGRTARGRVAGVGAGGHGADRGA
ncbi:hypothetical protein G6F22_016714 [Rhizopus arrhizus]|nr:hypothetical protein G6F22_016714 [Rhizopus arrhizus]